MKTCTLEKYVQNLCFRPKLAAIGAALVLSSFCSAGGAGAQEPAPPDAATYPGQADNGASEAAQTLPAAIPATDPPSRVARVSLLSGNVSNEPAGVNTFSPAELNQVLTTGDRLYTDASAEAELQAGQLAVRLGGGADVTVTAMTDALAQFGVTTGSVHLRSLAIDPGTVVELDSPEAAITVLQPGDVRVDVDPATHTTTITLVAGQVQVDGPGSSQVLTPGQRVRVHGGNPEDGEAAFTEPLSFPDADGLDSFSTDRDNREAGGLDAASPYVNADTVGSADLADFGSWETNPETNGETTGIAGNFGPVWFPVVAVDWHPYCNGHWRWVVPWGWTWVGAEPWGFAPFHYGRWAHFGDGTGGRWGWIPGPRTVRPVYAPALVAFAGGAQFAASLGFAPGFSITAWFPLGPREPYLPPYHGSIHYLNRINASNLYNPNTAEVRGFYNQRAVNVFGGAVAGNHGYANRLAATTAVPQSSFAAGRSVQDANLRLPGETLANAPLLRQPLGNPERSAMVPRSVMALPPNVARPVLAGKAAPERGPNGVAGTVLFHRAEPPSSRPSFDHQRQAAEPPLSGRPVPPSPGNRSQGIRPTGTVPPRAEVPHPSPGRASEPAHSTVPAPAAPAPAQHH